MEETGQVEKRTEQAHRAWRILIIWIAVLPWIFNFPPWQDSGQYYPVYGTRGFRSVFAGSEPMTEGILVIATMCGLVLVARTYWWAVERSDIILSTNRLMGWTNETAPIRKPTVPIPTSNISEEEK